MEMSIKEAIKRIREHNEIHKNKEPNSAYITHAIEMAIQALEKREESEPRVAPIFENERTAKILEERGDLNFLTYKCPVCNAIVANRSGIVKKTFNCCSSCGQKIKEKIEMPSMKEGTDEQKSNME